MTGCAACVGPPYTKSVCISFQFHSSSVATRRVSDLAGLLELYLHIGKLPCPAPLTESGGRDEVPCHISMVWLTSLCFIFLQVLT